MPMTVWGMHMSVTNIYVCNRCECMSANKHDNADIDLICTMDYQTTTEA